MTWVAGTWAQHRKNGQLFWWTFHVNIDVDTETEAQRALDENSMGFAKICGRLEAEGKTTFNLPPELLN